MKRHVLFRQAGAAVLLCGMTALPLAGAAERSSAAIPTWDGWIVGRPCAVDLRVADCPLRFADDPVLLLENGEVIAFRFGEGTSVRELDLDKAYGKKVRLTGALTDGAIQSVRMDLLEQSGERKFFKGCL